jgi:IS1 family transposase
MAVGDYCALIPLVAEKFGHTMTEVAVVVEIAARRLWIGIEDLQTMELIRFVLGRPSPTKLLALRELCVTAQMEICVQADWRAINLPRCAAVA